MQKIFSVWKNTSKNGKTYYSGKLGDLQIIGFENIKENEKQPDIVFYVSDEKQEKKKEEPKTDPFEDFGKEIEITDDILD